MSGVGGTTTESAAGRYPKTAALSRSVQADKDSIKTVGGKKVPECPGDPRDYRGDLELSGMEDRPGRAGREGLSMVYIALS